MFYFEVQSALVNAMLRALAEPLGSRAIGGAYGSTNLHTGEGQNADGTPWFSAAELEAQYGAWGATDSGDGNNHCGLAMLNMIMPAVEEIEPRVPALILDREYLPDTAGPGTHRGGAGLVKQSVFLSGGEHHLVPLHFRTPSGSGVCGGGDGRAGGAWWLHAAEGGSERHVLCPPTADDFRGATAVAGRVDPATGVPDTAGAFAFFGRTRCGPRHAARCCAGTPMAAVAGAIPTPAMRTRCAATSATAMSASTVRVAITACASSAIRRTIPKGS